MSLVQLNIMYGHLEELKVSLRGTLQVISPSRLVSIRSMGWDIVESCSGNGGALSQA